MINFAKGAQLLFFVGKEKVRDAVPERRSKA